MLMPKKTKYRKQMRGTIKGISTRGNSVDFGEYGLKAMSKGFLSSRQLEAARKAIAHHTKRGGRLWIRVFPSKPIVKKPNETRMGSGKAPVDHYAAVILPGRIILEVGGLPKSTAFDALRKASHKFPIRTRIVWDTENA